MAVEILQEHQQKRKLGKIYRTDFEVNFSYESGQSDLLSEDNDKGILESVDLC